MTAPLRVGLVAGEASGDTLGADLIEALRRLVRTRNSSAWRGRKCRPRVARSGSRPNRSRSWDCSRSCAICRGCCGCWRASRRVFLAARPDVFVGIDAPDTNLRLARRLHAAGIPTVQYVSPQVWAWRQGRVARIHRSVDLVLCLLPFEKRFYDEQGIAAEFVGHPLADAIPLTVDRAAARARAGPARSGATSSRCCRAAGAAKWRGWRRISPRPRLACRAAPGLKFVAPMASRRRAQIFARALERMRPRLEVLLIDGQAQTALIAADVVLVASGTASLEAALCKRPMVVVYRLGAIDGVGAHAAESGQSQVFCAAKSTCGSARRRRVFSGTDRP